ncbi:MAG: methyl-accepting chemotaxis protein, partial [Dehalococcoidales bacterium]|nr:methyl-accepting chemotaxis protein [Dehalococcoidales bacterium]
MKKGIRFRIKPGGLSIRGKLIAGFSLILFLMLGIFGVGYYGLDYTGKAADRASAGAHEQLLWSQWNANVLGTIADYEYYFLSLNTEWLNQAEERWAMAKEKENELAQFVDSSSSSLFTSISEKVAGVKMNLELLAHDFQGGYKNDFSTSINIQLIGQTVNNMMTNINDGMVQAANDAKILSDARDRQQQGFALIMIMIVAIAVLIAICIIVLLPQSISKGINSINRALQKMADRDLTEKVNIKSSDEIGHIILSYNNMQQYLSKLVAQLKSNTGKLSSASEQLAVAARQSSDSTQQVAASSQQ